MLNIIIKGKHPIMKFENIAIDDTVYIRTGVRDGYNTAHFWIPRKVEKVTPKQFMVSGERYKKEDGAQIGDVYAYACNLGDNTGSMSGGDVTNQMKEKNDFVHKRNMCANISLITRKLGSINFSADTKNLVEINALMQQIEDLL